MHDAAWEISARLLAGREDCAGDARARAYPDAGKVVGLVHKIRMAVFPDYYGADAVPELAQGRLVPLLSDIRQGLTREIETALPHRDGDGGAPRRAEEISDGLLERLPDIQRLLYKDAQAGFEGDPAARSVGEVILTYPGFFALFVYRVAHFLFSQNVPLIPRIMSEHAHSVTGIDIHPGAVIGEHFFIDHGTGVVIGETTVIGNRVKLYQGVTLGALSTKSGQRLSGVRRHPTIEDNVTIYSGATILGGETVIGENATVGGNAFIVKSVPKDVRAL